MDNHFSLMMFLVLCAMAANAHRGEASPADEARAAERRRKFRATWPLLAASAFLYGAALAALPIVGILLDLATGHPSMTIGRLLAIPALGAVSALLGWIGVRLFRDKRLLGRLAGAWSAAVEAFAASNPDEPKPKAARADRDFD